ncbi:hypothetical protein [Pseudomonas muyukensis]|uniref:Alginate lyase n=1 Tax=Pseudomonas muyukensis TaxID=2842357 RepID=A0ABX8M5K1_9PSED|nr:hypothetical protein [Pseudomonas muyukensis]QXH34268.1 hypothetical protein KSS95_19240 [Pseudomonas muyukensis]
MKFKQANNLPTAFLSDSEARHYIEARSQYQYPKAYLEKASAQQHDIALSGTLFGRFVVCPASNTDLSLDDYHHQLLNANDPADRLLGLASVIYWGYFTFGDAYARNRVDWFINGHQAQPPTTASLAHAHTTRALHHLTTLNMAQALHALNGLSQLSRTPFASKVIAFMAPSVAGIYDNRIATGLASASWASGLSSGIGQIHSSRVQHCYQSWCLYLSQVASHLNLGIGLGKPWQWSCGKDQGQAWRALDVERAFFALYGMGDRRNPENPHSALERPE